MIPSAIASARQQCTDEVVGTSKGVAMVARHLSWLHDRAAAYQISMGICEGAESAHSNL